MAPVAVILQISVDELRGTILRLSSDIFPSKMLVSADNTGRRVCAREESEMQC